MPSKFFITHSHKDNAFVARLADDLEKVGLKGFLDIYSLKAGDLISREISRGLEACDVYMPVLSHAALDSPWCELEIHTAITLSNEVGRSGRPRIIPLLVEECQLRLDPFLRSRLYLKFHEGYDTAFLNLLRAVGIGGAIGGVKPNVTPTAPKGEPAKPIAESKPTPIQEQPRIEVITPEPKIITPPPPPKIQLPTRKTNKAGQEMILIPAGEFLMGSNDSNEDAREREKPQHRVYLDACYISRYPVTNADYKKFKSSWDIPRGKENHPVANVTWDDAVAFCKWVEGDLPTEAQWEKAASWEVRERQSSDDAKKIKRVYPWGDTFDTRKCNTRESGINTTTPVGKYSPQGDSMYGVGDMAGNVWEWCADSFEEKYYSKSPRENPRNNTSGPYRVLRGGAWSSASRFARCANRESDSRDLRNSSVGFRVAESVP